MREILFRGKRVDSGELVYGWLCRVGDKYANIVEKGTEVLYSVSTKTIGQYTGLTDRNGKKIFEGDCFKTYCAGLPVYKHIVGYYPEHFAFMARCIKMNTVHYLSDYRPSAIEVIGNIYDNPELLEVTE